MSNTDLRRGSMAKSPSVEEKTESNAGTYKNAQAPGVKIADAKEALSNASSLLRVLYLAAITYYTGLLVQRPILIKPESLASARLYHDMLVEMVFAFSCVSVLHFGIILHDFVATSRPVIASAYGWIVPMCLWFFTMSWMIAYTMHIPLVYQRPWQWVVTVPFVVFNFAITASLKVRCLYLKSTMGKVQWLF